MSHAEGDLLALFERTVALATADAVARLVNASAEDYAELRTVAAASRSETTDRWSAVKDRCDQVLELAALALRRIPEAAATKNWLLLRCDLPDESTHIFLVRRLGADLYADAVNGSSGTTVWLGRLVEGRMDIHTRVGGQAEVHTARVEGVGEAEKWLVGRLADAMRGFLFGIGTALGTLPSASRGRRNSSGE